MAKKYGHSSAQYGDYCFFPQNIEIQTFVTFTCKQNKHKQVFLRDTSQLSSKKKYSQDLVCFNVKTNCFMWNKKLFRSKVYCIEYVCWANEVQLMEYLNIWSILLNINTIKKNEKTKRRQKQYQHH